MMQITPSDRVVSAVQDEASSVGLDLSHENAYRLAYAAINDDITLASFEQRIANDNVREMRRTGYCPTCGAEN